MVKLNLSVVFREVVHTSCGCAADDDLVSEQRRLSSLCRRPKHTARSYR